VEGGVDSLHGWILDATLRISSQRRHRLFRPDRRADRPPTGRTSSLRTITLHAIEQVHKDDAMLTYRAAALMLAVMTLTWALPQDAEARGVRRAGSHSTKSKSTNGDRDPSPASSAETTTSSTPRTRVSSVRPAGDAPQAPARAQGQARPEPAPGPDVECADGSITRAPGGCSRHGGAASRVRKR